MINEVEIRCPHCDKTFEVLEEEQMPGYRMKDYLYCPYCKKLVRESMEWEWTIVTRP